MQELEILQPREVSHREGLELWSHGLESRGPGQAGSPSHGQLGIPEFVPRALMCPVSSEFLQMPFGVPELLGLYT